MPGLQRARPAGPEHANSSSDATFLSLAISYLKNDHWSDTSPFIEVNSIIGRIYLDKMHGQVLHVHFIWVISIVGRNCLDEMHVQLINVHFI